MQNITIRPSLKQVRLQCPTAVAVFGATPALGFAVIGFARAGNAAGWMGAAVVCTLGLVFIVVSIGEWLYLRNATIFLEADKIGLTDWRGRTQTAPLGDLRQVELTSAPIRGTRSEGPMTRFIAKDGTPIFELRGKEFARDDLQRLSVIAGVNLVGAWPGK